MKLTKLTYTLSGELITFVIEARDEFANIGAERKFFTSAERLSLVRKITEEDEVLRTLKSKQVTIVPLNDPMLLSHLSKGWVYRPFSPQPLNEIRAYLGEEIAFYFGFLGVYTAWLVPPAALGLLIYFHQTKHGFATFETLAYSVFLAVWATLFLEHWKRREKKLGYEWGCLDIEEREVDEARLEEAAEGDSMNHLDAVDPSSIKTILGYFSSYTLISIAFVSGVLVMGFLLQLDTHAQQHWKGMEWDGLWSFAVYVPNILLSTCITIYKSMNKSLAVFTTRLEQRRSEVEQREAMVTKLVAFNFVNYYAALIHTAFVMRDLIKLRQTLMTLLVVQQVVGQLTEVGVPLLKGAFNFSQSTSKDDKEEVVDDNDKSKSAILARAKREAALETYAGVFDDYLELWVQMGQVCLFSSVFPLAALVALLNNVIEIRSDAFKIIHASQRPIPNRKSGIGSWLPMFDFLGYAAVITNISLVGMVIMSSPSTLRELEQTFGLTDLAVLLLLVGAEHLLMVFKVGLSFIIPDVPEDVKMKLRLAAKREDVARTKNLEHRAKMRHLFSQFKTVEGVKNSLARPGGARDEAITEAIVEFVSEQAIARTHAETERDRAEREMKRLRASVSSQSLGFLAVVVNVAMAIIGAVLLLSGR